MDGRIELFDELLVVLDTLLNEAFDQNGQLDDAPLSADTAFETDLATGHRFVDY